MNKVYVFGHKNPDTDSICSSIAYAELKKQLGEENISAYRLGKINKETQFVLNYFNVEKPPFLSDIKIKIEDLDLYKPITLNKNDPIKKAWDSLNQRGSGRLIPVIDEESNLDGIVSIGDITKIFMDTINDDSKLLYDILFQNLLDILEAKLVYGKYNYEKIEGNLYIGSSAIFSNKDITDKDIVITAKVSTARKCALDLKCGCVIIVNDQIPEGLENSEAAIVVVRKNIYNTIGMVSQAISIKSIMRKENILYFSTDSYIEDILDITKTSYHRNFPVINNKGQYVGVLSRRHLTDYEKKKAILIDHNERSQSVEGLWDANIIEIIDHHRVADIQTETPLYIRSEPVGCTATIVFKMYRENSVSIKEEIAGILLSAILSDTLMFSSPTCTFEDRETAKKLAEICNVNIEVFGREMFSESTSLEGFTPKDILSIDLKKFSFGKFATVISQVNTLDFKSIAAIKDDLLEAMEDYNNKYNNDLAILMITDIVIGGSEILVSGSNRARKLAINAFGLEKDNDSIFLDGVVSRKKQMVPKLTTAARAF